MKGTRTSAKETRAEGPTLALAMIVRDEESVLQRCLMSVLGIVDEVVIVDTGSTDGTIALVEGFTARYGGGDIRSRGVPLGVKLLSFEWCDDFSAARNFALDHVSTDWVLHLDADEELAGATGDLPRLMSDQRYVAYDVPAVVAAGKDDLDNVLTSFSGTRLFRNDPQLRYRFPIHEHIRVEDQARYGNCDLLVIHFGPVSKEGRSGHERNLRILNRAVKEHPDEGFLWERLGAQHFSAGDFSAAFEAHRKAIEVSGLNNAFAPRALRDMAMCMFITGRHREALAAAQRLQRSYPKFTDLVFMEAEFELKAGRLKAAERLYRQCIQIGDPAPTYGSWGGTGSWRAQEGLSEVLGRLKDKS